MRIYKIVKSLKPLKNKDLSENRKLRRIYKLTKN
jgi:hypothetical protein|nr:MAG TPA: hypothetical protein [Caudoviricetes sp.]